MLLSDEPEVILPIYSQAAILHAAHFRRIVKVKFYPYKKGGGVGAKQV